MAAVFADSDTMMCMRGVSNNCIEHTHVGCKRASSNKEAFLQGMNMSEMFLDAVQQAGITPELADAGLVLQCFSLPALEEFAAAQRARGFDIPLVWLVACEKRLARRGRAAAATSPCDIHRSWVRHHSAVIDISACCA